MDDQKRVTLRDVADRAGVSTAVVSYVINGGPRPTSADVRERVRVAVEELDYHPNSAARGLRGRRTHTIAFVTYDFLPHESFFSHYLGLMLSAMTATLQTQGHYALLFPLAIGDELSPARALFKSGRLDGVAARLVQDTPHTDALLDLIASSHLPCVCLERPGAPMFNFRTVTYDDAAGARLAVQHLLEKGHRRIGHLHGDMRYATARARLHGYKDALSEAGIAIDPALIVGSRWNTRQAIEHAHSLFDLADRPTAIFSASDDLAIGAMHAAADRGLSVPNDLAVIGFDDIPLSGELTPRLSTVRVPLRQMGSRAAHILSGSTVGDDDPRIEVLPVELVLREST